VPARPRGVSEQRDEPPHPAIDGDVINLDDTLGLQLFNIAIREPVAKVPTYRAHDHIRREPEPSELRQLSNSDLGVGTRARRRRISPSLPLTVIRRCNCAARRGGWWICPALIYSGAADTPSNTIAKRKRHLDGQLDHTLAHQIPCRHTYCRQAVGGVGLRLRLAQFVHSRHLKY
jgi:hypothetical protein